MSLRATSVKTARSHAGLSQFELSTKSGVDQSAISRIENGDANLTSQTAQKLALVLGVSASELIAGQTAEAAVKRATKQIGGKTVPIATKAEAHIDTASQAVYRAALEFLRTLNNIGPEPLAYLGPDRIDPSVQTIAILANDHMTPGSEAELVSVVEAVGGTLATARLTRSALQREGVSVKSAETRDHFGFPRQTDPNSAEYEGGDGVTRVRDAHGRAMTLEEAKPGERDHFGRRVS